MVTHGHLDRLVVQELQKREQVAAVHHAVAGEGVAEARGYAGLEVARGHYGQGIG